MSSLSSSLFNFTKPHVAPENSILNFCNRDRSLDWHEFETVIKQCLDVEGSGVCTLKGPPKFKASLTQNPTGLGASPFTAKCSNPKLKPKKRLLLCFPRKMAFNSWLRKVEKEITKSKHHSSRLLRSQEIKPITLNTPCILTLVINKQRASKQIKIKCNSINLSLS